MKMIKEAPRTAIASVCVVGLGAVGGPTASYFASVGIPTYGCDINPRAASALGLQRTYLSRLIKELQVREKS